MGTIDRTLEIVRRRTRLVPVLGFLAVLVLVPMAGARAAEETCDREEIANTGCKGPKDCLYADINNCSGFIQCVPQPDGSGKPLPMSCPAGLEWNAKERKCDWPVSSTCGQGTNKPVAPVPAHLKEVCRTQKPGLYADPKRCECFYECNNGIRYKCCNPGLLYQVKGHMCAAPSEVQCGNRTPPAK